MEAKNKNLLIGGLLAIVLVMAVGYAAFATQLNITGTAKITSTWDVHIKSIEAQPTTTTASSKSAEVGEDKVSATFETDLVAPGDSITYKVVVENLGSLPAKVTDIKLTQGHTNTETEEGKDNRTIIYNYTDIAIDDKLAANGGTDEFFITVTYNPQITTQPATDAEKTSVLNLQLSYGQDTTAAPAE